MSTSLGLANQIGLVNCGRDYLAAQPDPRTAWETCARGDWLGWVIDRVPAIDRRLVATAACRIARMALALVPEDEPRPAWVIETTESWVRGSTTQAAAVRLAGSIARAEANEAVDPDVRAALWASHLAAGCADGSTGLEPLCTYVASRVGEFSMTSAECASIIREVILYTTLENLVREVTR